MKQASPSQHPDLEKRPKGFRQAVHACESIPLGSVISLMEGEVLRVPDKFSLQLDGSSHLDITGQLSCELNHSCSANAYVDFSESPRLTIRALRDIPQEDEITINYCASEDRMSHTFTCDCGSDSCYGEIRGYAFLTAEQQRQIDEQLSPYLQSMR